MDPRVRAVLVGVAATAVAGAVVVAVRRWLRAQASGGEVPAAVEAPAEFVCPITRELMADPVVTADGHTYERHAIRTWLETSDISPRTGARLANKTMVPNFSLRTQIGDYRKLHGLPPMAPLEQQPPALVAPPPAPAQDETHEAVQQALAEVFMAFPLLTAQAEFSIGLSPHGARRGDNDLMPLAQLASVHPPTGVLVHNFVTSSLEAALVFFNTFSRCVARPPPIVECVWRGDVASIERLVESRQADPAMNLPEGRTLLHLAAFAGQIRVVQYLLSRGLYVDAVDARRATPLHMAAFGGHRDVVELCLSKGASINARALGGTAAVHLAAFRGHLELVKLLIETHHADVLCTKENGQSLLHIAAQAANAPLVTYLLSRGGSDFVQISDNTGATPLHSAMQGGSLEIAQMIVDAGVDLNARTQPAGELALHTAAWLSNLDMVRFLLDLGCLIDAQRTDGCTIMHYSGIRGDTALARLLIERQADLTIVRNDGFTPLHTTCWFKHPDVARLLIDAHSPLEARTSNQSTALHFACWVGHAELVRMLVDAGASIEARTQDGDTALHQAVFNNHRDAAIVLLEHFAQTVIPGALPHSGSTAALSETFINARKRDGSTALHLAAIKGLHDMVLVLLAHGSDRALTTRGGMTAVDLARQHNHVSVVQALEQQ